MTVDRMVATTDGGWAIGQVEAGTIYEERWLVVEREGAPPFATFVRWVESPTSDPFNMFRLRPGEVALCIQGDDRVAEGDVLSDPEEGAVYDYGDKVTALLRRLRTPGFGTPGS